MHFKLQVAQDPQHLCDALAGVSLVDDFTRQLVDIHKDIYVSGRRDLSKDIRLHILRSDYMIDSTDPDNLKLKQVEINTIAAGAAGLAGKTTQLHRYLLSRLADSQSSNRHSIQNIVESITPDNNGIKGIASAISSAHLAYAKRYKGRENTCRRLAVLYVVPTRERNEVDQRTLEHELYNQHGVRCR
jgi:glutathione synthase